MRSQELPDTNCAPAEEMTPMRELVATKLRSMMHAYLNGTAQVESVEG